MAEHRSGAGPPRLRLLQGTLLFLCWKGAARREGDGEELVLMRDATLSELSSRLEAPPRTLMASASEEPVRVEMGLVLVELAMFTSLFSRDETLAKDPWLPPRQPGCHRWPSSRPSRVYRCSEGGGCW